VIVFQPQRTVGSHARAASPAPSLGAAAWPTGIPSNQTGSGAASYAHIAAAAAAAATAGSAAAAAAAAGPGPHQGPPHQGPPHQGPPHQGPPHQGPPNQGLPHRGPLHQGPQAPSQQQQQQQQLAHQHMQAGLLPDQQQTSAAVQQAPTSQQQQQQDLQSALQQLAQQQQQQQQASRPAAYATGIASFPPTLPPSSALLSTHHTSHQDAAGNTAHTAPGSALPAVPLKGVLLQQQQQQQQQQEQEQQAGPVGQAPGWPSQDIGGRQYIAEVEQTRQMSASVPAASQAGMHFESCFVISAPLQHGSGSSVEIVQHLFGSTGRQQLCYSAVFIEKYTQGTPQAWTVSPSCGRFSNDTHSPLS